MPKTKWAKEIPTEEGWYWVKYRNKRNKTTMCPARVIWIDTYVCVDSARNDSFQAGPDHGGPQLSCHGKIDKTIRFGPRIIEPE